VIVSPLWNAATGAVTHAHGSFTGTPSAANSLIGHAPGDLVGTGLFPFNDVTVLADGNYVVASPNWSDPAGKANVGAVTWCSATAGCSGEVSTANSLIGAFEPDQIGYGPNGSGVTALAGGRYLVSSPYAWQSNASDTAGALTWMAGGHPRAMQIALANSLMGGTAQDHVGSGGVLAQADGDLVVLSPYWSDSGCSQCGSIALISGAYANTGKLRPDQHVRGGVAGKGATMTYVYDAQRHRLVVGRPAENRITWLTRDDLFADAFEN
jgi:hypothetical protein